ncbi:uncharacterized protein LOC141622681 [Silene latifolia]|uniref:uncharacterized protein LOC141622681 n=1 Tax=Silene latifolia TaxID=37657 RepID=UPI003D78B0C8
MKETGMRWLAEEKMKIEEKEREMEKARMQCLAKEKMERWLAREKMELFDDSSVPYKISYPGHYDPYHLRPSKDPRLGEAQKTKEIYYQMHGFKLDDDVDVDLDLGPPEDDDRDYFPDGIIEIVTLPPNTPFPNLPCRYTEAQRKSAYERNLKFKLNVAVKYEEQYLKKQDCDCAERAIKYYNQMHGTDYEIVETLGSYQRIYTGFWFHCNFRAKCFKSDPSSPPKLFFAELNRVDHANLMVKVCMPLDDGLVIRVPIVRGCEMCDNQLFHPVNGFQVGRKLGSSSSPCHRGFY